MVRAMIREYTGCRGSREGDREAAQEGGRVVAEGAQRTSQKR